MCEHFVLGRISEKKWHTVDKLFSFIIFVIGCE